MNRMGSDLLRDRRLGADYNADRILNHRHGKVQPAGSHYVKY